MATKENHLRQRTTRTQFLSWFFLFELAFCLRQYNTKMKFTASFNQKILLRCKQLLIKITRSCPRRHYRHLKLKKVSSSSPPSSGKKVNKVFSSFFLSFQKKKQKKERMKRLNELRSFSDSVSEKKASNSESRKKVFPSSLTPSCLGQGKAHPQEVSQDYDPHRNSTSAFLP